MLLPVLVHVALFTASDKDLVTPSPRWPLMRACLSSFDFAEACQAFEDNPLKFRNNWIGRNANFEATVASFQQSGRTFWVGVYPRTKSTGGLGGAAWELMGSLFFASIPKAAALSWQAGDLISINGTLVDVTANYQDQVRLSGTTSNGFGYVTGGTVKVRTLVWSFRTKTAKRLKSLEMILREEGERAKLEEALQEANQKRESNQLAFGQAIRDNDVAKMRDLIAMGVEYQRSQEGPYLLQAVEAESFTATRFLLRLPGIDVNETASDGDTALQIAYRKSNVALIKLLREAGAKGVDRRLAPDPCLPYRPYRYADQLRKGINRSDQHKRPPFNLTSPQDRIHPSASKRRT